MSLSQPSTSQTETTPPEKEHWTPEEKALIAQYPYLDVDWDAWNFRDRGTEILNMFVQVRTLWPPSADIPDQRQRSIEKLEDQLELRAREFENWALNEQMGIYAEGPKALDVRLADDEKSPRKAIIMHMLCVHWALVQLLQYISGVPKPRMRGVRGSMDPVGYALSMRDDLWWFQNNLRIQISWIYEHTKWIHRQTALGDPQYDLQITDCVVM